MFLNCSLWTFTVIADSLRDVCIKVSDRGGGIPRSDMTKIWGFVGDTI